MDDLDISEDENYDIYNEQSTSVTGRPSLPVQRQRRRASQARHRLNVATCYGKLRMAVPSKGSVNDQINSSNCMSSSAMHGKGKLNKAALLRHAKEYVVYLENVLGNVLHSKLSDEQKVQTAFRHKLSVIENFTSVSDFAEHFASKFDTDCHVSDYFEEDPANRGKRCRYDARTQQCRADGMLVIDNQQTQKNSQSYSDDLGFVSADGGSQEQIHAYVKKTKESCYTKDYFPFSPGILRASNCVDVELQNGLIFYSPEMQAFPLQSYSVGAAQQMLPDHSRVKNKINDHMPEHKECLNSYPVSRYWQVLSRAPNESDMTLACRSEAKGLKRNRVI